MSKRSRQNRRDTKTIASFPLSFGRFRNKPLSQVPIYYLRWLVGAESVPDADRWAVTRYLQNVERRRKQQQHQRRQPKGGQQSTARQKAGEAEDRQSAVVGPMSP